MKFKIIETYTCIYTYIHIFNFSFQRLGQHMLYWFNSRSNSPGTNYGRCVHIFAHGQWIRSASHT